jgi:hypothetical protein
MQTANRIAFKEWAAVCRALATGRQVLIARKGGIHEGRAGFRVAHREFWLFPTYVHQQAEGLADEGRPFLEQALAERPTPGTLRIGHYATVEEVMELPEAAALPGLAGLHIWSPRTLDERFHYRQPGLFLLVVRVYHAPRMFELVESPHFAGCRSWVDLPADLATDGLTPVLAEHSFQAAWNDVRQAVASIRPV